MMKRISCYLIPFLIITCVFCSTFTILGEEEKTYYFGTNSSSGGYVTQLNNKGAQSYLKFVSVAPIVNRVRIVNQDNGAIVFDDKPAAGSTAYVPAGRYVITGWSAYGTDDAHAVAVMFQNAQETPAQSSATPSQITVDGSTVQSNQSTTTIYSNGSYGGSYYPYNYYPYPQPTSSYIWCSACGKYHTQDGCIFTKKTKSVFDQTNPYWRGNK